MTVKKSDSKDEEAIAHEATEMSRSYTVLLKRVAIPRHVWPVLHLVLPVATKKKKEHMS